MQKAFAGLQAEVIVIDNNSTDQSMEYLEPAFSQVRFISNNENIGFAKACNQGLKLASGKYILFVNPDTIVPEDCFKKCISFLEQHADAGALGIKMLDGRGYFLKESKRSFPSPLTSLFKLFGLSRLFPRSKIFSKYHLGNLDENKNNEVDVLAGAFMMIKKEVLEKVGSFDEVFFMYGEDVDLSYRIQKAGYKNYYFAESSIVHFKGESTRKGTMNYVRMFYTAMSVFVRKHYSSGRAGLFNFLIHIAIWFRAAFSALGQFIRRIGLPLIDAGLILLSFWLMKLIWGEWVRPETEYEKRLLWIAFPSYTVFYLIAAYYAGLYDRFYRRRELISSMAFATLVLLAAYALLPERFRFSRGILVFGSTLAFIFISLIRWLLIRTNVISSDPGENEKATTLVVASPNEFQQTTSLMKEAGLQEKILGRVSTMENDKDAIGYWKNLKGLNKTVPYREVIFCEGALSFTEIIDGVQHLPNNTRVKFHASGSRSIVGSDSKDRSGEAVSAENGFNLSEPYKRRLKRLIDVFVSLFGLITFPVQLIVIRKPIQFFGHCFQVLFAQKTWIGYAQIEKKLPSLRSSIIACNGIAISAKQVLAEESLHMLDYWYARDYEPTGDLKLLWRVYRNLGN